MTVGRIDTHKSPSTPDNGVDIAGTWWPLYKLEALAVGAAIFVAAALITQSMQTAVLAAAAITVATWWQRRTHYRRTNSAPVRRLTR